MSIGDSIYAVALVKSTTGRVLFGRKPSWTSDNPAVATVGSRGAVYGAGAGTANIRATLDGVTGEATITVEGDEPPPPTPPVATQLAITTQPSGGATGAIFATQPVLEVRDDSGIVVGASGALVTAAISSGVGVLGGTTTVAAVNGVATFTNLSIAGSGSFTLTFTSGTLTAATSNAITITLPPPTQLAMVSAPSSSAQSGSVFAAQPAVALLDAANQTVRRAGVSVSASIASGVGTLGGTTTVTTDSTGVATFTNLGITGAGTFVLSFASTGLASATSSTITVTLPPPTQLAMVSQPSSSAQSGSPFAAQPAVSLRDATNEPVRRAGVVVNAALASGVGTLGGTTAVATDSMGVARFTNLSITGSDTYVLALTSGGLTAATSTPISVTPPPPPPATQLAMVTQPAASALSGTVLAAQPVVALRDAAGLPVRQSGVTVSASIASGGGTLGGSTTVLTDANGVAAFSNLSITGTAGDRTLRFSAANLTAATSSAISITVPTTTPPPSGSRVMLFQSDWRNGTGTSTNAVMDGGRWSMIGGQGLEVVPSTGLGFPTANVLKVNALASTSGFALLRRTGLPVPASGESRFYRFYFQYTGPDGQVDRGSHPVQDGNAASDANVMFNIYHDGSAPNTWSFAWWPGNGIQPAAENRRFKLMANLAKGVTYRVEFQIHRISATEFNLHARIYDAAGTLLYDDDDFRGMDGLGTTTLANLPRLIFHNPANLDGLNAGNNGGSGMYASDYPHLYGYQAGFAVCGGDWCGAYVPGESP